MKPGQTAHRATGGFRVVIAATGADMQEHVAAWDTLAAASVEPNPFYESWMLLPALAAFGAENPPLFVMVYQDQPAGAARMCGFFPLCRRRPAGSRGEVLALWTHPHCFLCTPLLLAETADGCLRALLRWAARDRRGAAVMRWELIGADGHFQRSLGEFLWNWSGAWRVEHSITRALFRPCDDAEAYLSKTLSGSGRRDLRRHRRQLAENAGFEYRRLDCGDQAEQQQWALWFLGLEAAGWKGRDHTALASSAAAREYFMTITRSAASGGRLEMNGYFVDGRPIAMRCAFACGGGVFGFKMAFDESYARFSPGILLEVDSIRFYHDTSRIGWLDSCATPDSSLANRLYNDRRCLQTIVISAGSIGGDFRVASGPLTAIFRSIPRRIRHIIRGSSKGRRSKPAE